MSLLALLWFGTAIYAGYRLTERSFAWIEEPVFGLESAIETDGSPPRISEAMREGVPETWKEQVKNLSPQQVLCLQAAISPGRVQAAMQGALTPQETAAAQKCLE